MNFYCQRPHALYLLLLIIPCLLISVFQCKKILKNINFFKFMNDESSGKKRMKHFTAMMHFRTVFRCFAWACFVLAYSGLSWGTYLEPVSKNGNSVSFVFDISYSMNAKDAPGGKSRLEAAGEYASMLLPHLSSSTISVVLTKGDGVTVIPVTEDKEIVSSLVDSLNPQLISAGGTSLAKGIRQALKSFPEKSARFSCIYLFTDGDETDGQLELSLVEAIKSGVPVYIIGFGSEKETEILAGDGKTRVLTSLKADKIKKAIENAQAKTLNTKGNSVKVCYVHSQENGSALKLLEEFGDEKSENVTYEIKPVQRYSMFLGFSIMFFILSYLISEFNPEVFSKHKKNLGKASVLCVFLFVSCSDRFCGAKKILDSSWDYHQRKYTSATAGFLEISQKSEEQNDFILEQYSIYDLGTTYMALNESKAALNRFNQILPDSPDEVRFASFYNTGLIYYQNGEYAKAIENFKEALKIRPQNVDAKINLEISMLKAGQNAKVKEKSYSNIHEEESQAMKNALFNLIRENDSKQWKNSENEIKTGSANDY